MTRTRSRTRRSGEPGYTGYTGRLLASASLVLASCNVGSLQPAEPPSDALSDAHIETHAGQADEIAAAGRMSEIAVVILAADGREELRLGTGRDERTFLRAGKIVLESGGRAGPAVDFAPPGADGVEFEGRRYPGHFSVRAHPAAGLRLVNIVGIEDYVTGVVAAELAVWSALPAELEAQAVAVRTYALKTLAVRRAEAPEDPQRTVLFDSVEDQVWRGRLELRDSEASRAVEKRVRDAVEATRGWVLTRDGRLEDARFHAACGGTTAELTRIFVDADAGATPVRCSPCQRRAELELEAGDPDPERPLGWQHTFGAGELARLAEELGIGDRVLGFDVAVTDEGGRWIEATVYGPSGARNIPVDDLRRALGHQKLKSARIASTWPRPGTRIEGGLMIRGWGRGHGVGLCQEGARDYARAGWTARRILTHYYPGAELVYL